MTNEEKLDEARAEEAIRLQIAMIDGNLPNVPTLAVIAARLARENWTPPEPVDPDVLAYREWAASYEPGESMRARTLAGQCDDAASYYAYLAGARMAREQEQERAKGLVMYLETRAAEGRPYAPAVLAKYRGEA